MPSPDSMLPAMLDAIRRGFQPVPIPVHQKGPRIGGWQRITWDPNATEDQVKERLKGWGFDEGEEFNLGIVLGPQSGHLVDIDIDDPKARHFRHLLPRTRAKSGRPGSLDSHWWYIVEEEPRLPGIPTTRQYRLADNQTVTIEYRYDRGVQTVMPPSDWVPKNWAELGEPKQLIEIREWNGEPWGGDAGPSKIMGRKLAVQVALIALCTVLYDNWPKQGSRHEAYLSLAGALMRQGPGSVHPFWERNAGTVVRAMAEATLDDDGADGRESEAIPSTIKGIRDGKAVYGWPNLAKIIGDDQVTAARSLVQEIESLAGYAARAAGTTATQTTAATPPSVTPPAGPQAPTGALSASAPVATTPAEDPDGRNPVEVPAEEPSSWDQVDLEGVLNDVDEAVKPTVLTRDDGHSLFYAGRLNMLFAPSESGKTLITLYTCLEQMNAGHRVVFIDFEDDARNTIDRLRTMGATDDQIRLQFTYIRPDEPIASMQRDHWGSKNATKAGEKAAASLARTLQQVEPTFIVADGMTSIYSLHSLDSNNTVDTDVINVWLRSLILTEHTTVVVIDHMAKAAGKGSMPVGSQHKVSMIGGSLLQVWPLKQPVKGQPDGKVELIVLKDRIGEVRRYCGLINGKAQLAATITFDSSGKDDDGRDKTVITVESVSTTAQMAPAASGTQPAGKLRKINATQAVKVQQSQAMKNAREKMLLEAFTFIGDSLTGPQIEDRIKDKWVADGNSLGSIPTIRKVLVDRGILKQQGGLAGPNVRYLHVKPWEED